MVVEVPRRNADAFLRRLSPKALLDESRRIGKRDGSILVPVRAVPDFDFSEYGARIAPGVQLPQRAIRGDPRTAIQEELASQGIPPHEAPTKWERIGDVVVLRLSRPARLHSREIAAAFGRVLRARTVVEDCSGIHGPLRTPDVRVLWGDGTETIHVEAGVQYRLDVAKLMFSSGNVAERGRIADQVRQGEVVVDLFAGIGYFSLPIAVRSRPSAIYACELSPIGFRYLVENVRLNRADCVVPIPGDCSKTAPRGVADWVLMGHFDARDYLDVAFECLRGKGTIVYHALCPKEQVPEEPIRHIADAARAHWMQPVSIDHRIVKSYAPGIVHAVVHARMAPTFRHR